MQETRFIDGLCLSWRSACFLAPREVLDLQEYPTHPNLACGFSRPLIYSRDFRLEGRVSTSCPSETRHPSLLAVLKVYAHFYDSALDECGKVWDWMRKTYSTPIKRQNEILEYIARQSKPGESWMHSALLVSRDSYHDQLHHSLVGTVGWLQA